MLSEYISKALTQAQYKQLEDGSWYGEVKGFRGVWANASNIEKCRHELIEVLEGWLFLKIRDHDPLPKIRGTALKFKKVA